jgi:hypothetical protein
MKPEEDLKRSKHKGVGICDRLMLAYKFDFNKYNKSGPTFEEKVMKMNANDIGISNYSPQTAHIMITEFKNFMAVNATKTILVNDTEKSDCDDSHIIEQLKHKETINGVTYYSSLLHPPVHIDRIWKLLIQHSQVYFDFCMEICGAFLDRTEPSTDETDEKNAFKTKLCYSIFSEWEKGIRGCPYFELKVDNNTEGISLNGRYDVIVFNSSQENEESKFDASELKYPVSSSELSLIIDEYFGNEIKTKYSSSKEVYEIAEEILQKLPRKDLTEYDFTQEFKSEETKLMFEHLIDFEFPKNMKTDLLVTDQFFY